MNSLDLFDSLPPTGNPRQDLAPGAVLLRGLALADADALLAAVGAVESEAAFRQMQTPGGHTMSVAITNCGRYGWVSDRRGYRYDVLDPLTGRAWPAMPPALRGLAARAAAEAGYPGFDPDGCLVNRYLPGARMSLHQDLNERDMSQPIVSVSLGLDAVFLFGGATRGAPAAKYLLEHGDVAVWGGPSRLAFHGVAPLKDGAHAQVGRQRINLTFRRVERQAP